MDLSLEFRNLDRSPIKVSFLRKIGRLTIKKCGLEFAEKLKLSISAVSVGCQEMEKLNMTYRKKKGATDVLSFAEYRSRAGIKEVGDKEIYLGEIFLCYNDIRKYCARKKMNPTEELARAFAHGILHLLAFRHGRIMFSIQEEVARNFKNET